MSPQSSAAGRSSVGGPPPMLKKITGTGKTSAVGVQRRATISQADERLAEITNTAPASQTPTQELKRCVLCINVNNAREPFLCSSSHITFRLTVATYVIVT